MTAINAQMMGGSNTGTDRTAPTIGTITISPGSNSSVISWSTNENASAIIYYSNLPISMIESTGGTGVTISGSSLLVNSDMRTFHSASITGLQANTTYYYVVYVRDSAGNESITWPAVFTTSN